MKKTSLFFVTLVFIFSFFIVDINFSKATSLDCNIIDTLRLGSRGDQVACLQSFLGGLVVDSNFGSKTRVAVMAWQAGQGLVADGVFGPKSRAVWLANGYIGVLPEGCQPGYNFSPITGLSCVSIPGPIGGTTKPKEEPVISSIVPSSGMIGTQATIYGNNFTETGNRIKFGNSNSENDPNYSFSPSKITCFAYPCPERITFKIPSSYFVPCFYTNPSCEIATKRIEPGDYEVYVINENGTSNAVKFTVISEYKID